MPKYTATGDCDGWPNVSFDDCKQKCIDNELPNSGCINPANKCAYAVWSDNPDWPPGWCQLADINCTIVNANNLYITWKNPDYN